MKQKIFPEATITLGKPKGADPYACLIGFLVGSVTGILKEWWDSKGHGIAEMLDFVFTALGAFTGMSLTLIFTLIF